MITEEQVSVLNAVQRALNLARWSIDPILLEQAVSIGVANWNNWLDNTTLERLNIRLHRHRIRLNHKDELTWGQRYGLEEYWVMGMLIELTAVKELLAAGFEVSTNPDQADRFSNYWDILVNGFKIDLKLISLPTSKYINFKPFSKISTQFNAPENIALLFCSLHEGNIMPIHMITRDSLRARLKIAKFEKDPDDEYSSIGNQNLASTADEYYARKGKRLHTAYLSVSFENTPWKNSWVLNQT